MQEKLPDFYLTSCHLHGYNISYTFLTGHNEVCYVLQTGPTHITIKFRGQERTVSAWPGNFHFN